MLAIFLLCHMYICVFVNISVSLPFGIDNIAKHILPTNKCLKYIFKFLLNVRGTFIPEKYCQNVHRIEENTNIFVDSLVLCVMKHY